MSRIISRRQKHAKHVTVKGERDTGEEHQEYEFDCTHVNTARTLRAHISAMGYGRSSTFSIWST
jgi:hypothetical protein